MNFPQGRRSPPPVSLGTKNGQSTGTLLSRRNPVFEQALNFHWLKRCRCPLLCNCTRAPPQYYVRIFAISRSGCWEGQSSTWDALHAGDCSASSSLSTQPRLYLYCKGLRVGKGLAGPRNGTPGCQRVHDPAQKQQAPTVMRWEEKDHHKLVDTARPSQRDSPAAQVRTRPSHGRPSSGGPSVSTISSPPSSDASRPYAATPTGGSPAYHQ